ncbi:DUF1330 domain-containing protein [Thalassomonas viridans]|uniref:DUF1330 domain-containing protein n=1 Tax=Thalassomonas viridans TaxID=137584 RepID=A0AAE9Z6D1_9GAMM|nr:DUF1330 domain-containing protein [Thalassomonas viridans]WDE07102.1 DUF1330 domain-containing protein [Thalassomonas viridans]
MTLPVFLHIEARPNPKEMESLQAYSSQVPAIAKAHGAVPIATYDVETSLADTRDTQQIPAVFMVVSFPSRDAIMDFFKDPAYEALVPLRDRGFNHIRFYITSERI